MPQQGNLGFRIFGLVQFSRYRRSQFGKQKRWIMGHIVATKEIFGCMYVSNMNFYWLFFIWAFFNLTDQLISFAAFACHEQGASSLIYAPQHQLLISAGKKGDVCIFDVRQRSLRHRFQAHESAIKCLAIDPHEEHFVTGSADGDIRVSFHQRFLIIWNSFLKNNGMKNQLI